MSRREVKVTGGGGTAQPTHACGHPLDDKLDASAKPTGEKRTPLAPCRACHRASKKKRGDLRRATWGRGRLPDGAHFDLTYSERAGKLTWCGTLTVQTPSGPRKFVEHAEAVMTLLIKLDQLYRIEVGDFVVEKQTEGKDVA